MRFDRVRIFLTALWFWTYMMCCITQIVNVVLRSLLHHTPDILLSFQVPRIKSGPIIVSAYSSYYDKRVPVTNKLKLLINMLWDKDIEDENGNWPGGINADDVVDKYPQLVNSVLWIAYMLEIEKIHEKTNQPIVKYLLVDFQNKYFRRGNASREVPIILGEIPF